MDRGASQATVPEITRVGHDLATKLLLLLYLNKAKFKRLEKGLYLVAVSHE